MNEFELIRKLAENLPTNKSVVTGVGDDCAVLDLGLGDRFLLFKTDAVVEGFHFTAETPPARVGHKALARCLSDIAAMAGTPSSALVTIGLPPGFSSERVVEIYAGLKATAARHGVAIVGGETTTNPGGIFISIALLGTVEQGKCPHRSGAQAGDAIFVTGRLGGSLAGRHLDFEPRLAEARWLTAHFKIHAMLDLSDGLAGDLRHLLDASRMGADLLASAIPVSREARERHRNQLSPKPALLAALTDGEDFELLFTVAAKHAVALKDQWKEKFPDVPVSCIGKITAVPGLRLRDERGVKELTVHGYTHFA